MGGSDKDHTFQDSGPVHLKDVNWNNLFLDHKRAVAASLVKGVYVQEHDHQNNRKDTNRALAPPWWRSFHFHRFDILINKEDDSIYGCIYQLEPQLQKINGAPRFVIAFRGTLIKSESIFQDMISNFKIICQRFHRRELCQRATKEVEKILKMEQDPTKVWLAGHSLGSALAIHAGKEMAEKGVFLESFLFNPPFPALFNSIVTGKFANFFKGSEQRFEDEDSFKELSKWFPKLYVNQDDLICSTYITYFEERQKMFDAGAGLKKIWETMNSLREVMKNKIFGENADFYAFYLIPSAFLYIKTTNSSLLKKMKKTVFSRSSHELSQWWMKDSQIEERWYCFS